MPRFLQAVFALAAVLSAGVVIVFLMGAGLPREHDVSAVITIHASQGKLWSMMEDVSAQPKWRTGVTSVQELPNDPDGHRCWAETQRRMRRTLCEEVTDPPTTRVVALVDPSASSEGTWTYNLTALTADTTDVAIMEHAAVGPPLWRFLGHYVFHEDSSIRRYEADLQRAAQK